MALIVTAYVVVLVLSLAGAFTVQSSGVRVFLGFTAAALIVVPAALVVGMLYLIVQNPVSF